MNKFVLSVIGRDKPGVLARISTILFSYGCNIEDVSQTILQTEFASIFIVTNPADHGLDKIGHTLNQALEPLDLSAHLRPMAPQAQVRGALVQPFVITTKGVDKPGTISAVTTTIAGLDCNVTNFRAIITQDSGQDEMIMIFEVDVPHNVEHRHIRKTLQETCEKLGLDASVQHRDIFEALHRIEETHHVE